MDKKEYLHFPLSACFAPFLKVLLQSLYCHWLKRVSKSILVLLANEWVNHDLEILALVMQSILQFAIPFTRTL